MSKEDETELARWAAEGRNQADASLERYDLPMLNQALDQIDQIDIPPLDVEKSWEILDAKKDAATYRPLRVNAWLISIAASLLVLVGIFFLAKPSQETITHYQPGILNELPDGQSHALFKRGSSLTFERSNF